MAVRINSDASTLSAPRVVLSPTTLRSVAPTFAGAFQYDPTPEGPAFFGSVTRPGPINPTVLIDWWKLLERERR